MSTKASPNHKFGGNINKAGLPVFEVDEVCAAAGSRPGHRPWHALASAA